MFLYVINVINTDIYKIGISVNVKRRLSELQHYNHSKLNVLTVFKINDDNKEKEIHKIFESYKIHGEWFKIPETQEFIIQKCSDICGNSIDNKEITKTKVGRKPKLTVEKIKDALIQANYNRSKAAKILKVGRASFYNFCTNNNIILQDIEGC